MTPEHILREAHHLEGDERDAVVAAITDAEGGDEAAEWALLCWYRTHYFPADTRYHGIHCPWDLS